MPTEREFLHDLATPLSAVFMLLGMAEEKLIRSDEGKEALACLDRACGSIARMRQMMDARRAMLKEEGKP